MGAGEDATESFQAPWPEGPGGAWGTTGSAWARAAMPINRYLSGFISLERLPWLLSSARTQGAGSWVNNTLFSRKFHSTGAFSEEFDLNED